VITRSTNELRNPILAWPTSKYQRLLVMSNFVDKDLVMDRLPLWSRSACVATHQDHELARIVTESPELALEILFLTTLVEQSVIALPLDAHRIPSTRSFL